jgi:hypothetical protein
MTNEVTPNPQALDNFGDFDDSVEGDNNRAGGLLVGTRLKFTNEATWETDGDDYTDHILLASNIRRMEIKWGENGPIREETRELKPGQKFRDLEALNALCPKSEWREDFNGQLVGPWQRQFVLELANLETMERFSWPTSTVGGSICCRELADRINMKRRLEKRVDLWPLVKLSHCFMKTRFKGRERPDCKIMSWYPPEEESKNDKIEAAPTQPKLLPALEPASEPSLQEELKDKIVF